MWAIPIGTSSVFLKKKKNQVKSPSPKSRTPNSVRIRQSGRAGIRGVTLRSLLLSLVTWYLRDDKNNVLSIFMLGGSMQFSLHFN